MKYGELIRHLAGLKDNRKLFPEPDEPDCIRQKDIAALGEAMDIINDYGLMAEQYKALMEKYEFAKNAINRGMGVYQCPDCGRRVNRGNEHCHWCGRKIAWCSCVKSPQREGALFESNHEVFGKQHRNSEF